MLEHSILLRKKKGIRTKMGTMSKGVKKIMEVSEKEGKKVR
jgi:hypothetical protein